MSAPTQCHLDRVHSLLRSPRRRFIVSYLAEEGEGNVEDIAGRIAARERNQTVDAVEDDARKEVHVSLVHKHLPRLADHDVVEYDADEGVVSPAADLDAVESFVLEESSDDAPTFDELPA